MQSKNKLQASTVVDNKTGKSIPSTVVPAPRAALHPAALSRPPYVPLWCTDSTGRLPLRPQVRTSYGTHFDYGENQVVRDIEARVAAVTMLPAGAPRPWHHAAG